MLPRDERKALHERIAVALEDRFSEIIAAQPEIAADHFTKAGLSEPAIRYWTEAGNRAVRGSALIDAAKHFSEAIRLVQTLPASPARDQTELGLHLVLGPVTMAIKGYAAPETLQVFTRAQELAGPSSPPAEQLEILAGLFNVHYGRAELAQAQSVARQHLALAQLSGRDEARAHCFMGQTYSAQGAFEPARTHFERTLAIFAENAEDTRSLGVYGSQYVVSSAFLAGVYWALGDPEKAAASTASSIAYANRSGHLVSIALALITRLLTPIPGGLEGDPVRGRRGLAVLRPARAQQFRDLGALCARGDCRPARRPARWHRHHAGGDRCSGALGLPIVQTRATGDPRFRSCKARRERSGSRVSRRGHGNSPANRRESRRLVPPSSARRNTHCHQTGEGRHAGAHALARNRQGPAG